MIRQRCGGLKPAGFTLIISSNFPETQCAGVARVHFKLGQVGSRAIKIAATIAKPTFVGSYRQTTKAPVVSTTGALFQ